MKITIDLEHSISIHEAVEMIDEFNNQPWCKKASVVSDCSTCRDKPCTDNKKQKHIYLIVRNSYSDIYFETQIISAWKNKNDAEINCKRLNASTESHKKNFDYEVEQLIIN